ncbi:universal stress protein [Sorangium sp. So ce542]|uniref:universal stress protein n=1 Tax=Sorangium sp. So ce542 TaxID=3133316 RepID=UPI003F639D74
MESNPSSTSAATRPFNVLAAVDLSPASRGVLLRALWLANAEETGGEVHVVAVADSGREMLGLQGLAKTSSAADAAARLQELATSVVNEFAVPSRPAHVERVVTHLLTGDPAREIVWLAAHVDADLIVMGTHGRTGVKRVLLGSVAERVVRTAGCPVCVVRDKHHDDSWRIPEIEPPCPDCLAERNRTGGASLWCARHQGHVHAHVYSGAETTRTVRRAMRPWGFST